MAQKHEEKRLQAALSRDEGNIIVFPAANQSGAAAVPFSDFGTADVPRAVAIHTQSAAKFAKAGS